MVMSPPQGYVASSVIPQELWYDVRDYGAAIDGSTDDTTAWQSAMNANLTQPRILYFPGGTSRITSINPRAGTTILGDGPGASIWKLVDNANTSMIAFPASADDVTIQGVKIDGNRTNESPGGQIHGIVTNTNTSRLRLRDVSIVSTWDNGLSLNSGNADVWLDNCFFNDNGRQAMLLSGSRLRIEGCSVVSPGARIAAAGMNLSTVVDSFIRGNFVTGGTDDSITLTGTSLRNTISQNNLQSATLSGIETNSTSVDNALIGNILKSHTQHGIHITGRQVVTGNLSILNGLAGIKCNGSVAFSRPSLVGNICRDNGAAVAEQFGIEFTGTVTDAVINGNVCTDTGPATQLTGIALGNTDFSVVNGNDLRGNVTSGLTFGTGTSNRIYDNIGFNPQGVAAITVTASPFTYTNNDNVPESVYIAGGTVSAVAKNSINVFTVAGDTSVWLEPTEAVTVTYTVAPVMNRDRK